MQVIHVHKCLLHTSSVFLEDSLLLFEQKYLLVQAHNSCAGISSLIAQYTTGLSAAGVAIICRHHNPHTRPNQPEIDRANEVKKWYFHHYSAPDDTKKYNRLCARYHNPNVTPNLKMIGSKTVGASRSQRNLDGRGRVPPANP